VFFSIACYEYIIFVLATFYRSVLHSGDAVAVLGVVVPLPLVLEAVRTLCHTEPTTFVALPVALVGLRYVGIQELVLDDEGGVGRVLRVVPGHGGHSGGGSRRRGAGAAAARLDVAGGALPPHLKHSAQGGALHQASPPPSRHSVTSAHQHETSSSLVLAVAVGSGVVSRGAPSQGVGLGEGCRAERGGLADAKTISLSFAPLAFVVTSVGVVLAAAAVLKGVGPRAAVARLRTGRELDAVPTLRAVAPLSLIDPVAADLHTDAVAPSVLPLALVHSAIRPDEGAGDLEAVAVGAAVGALAVGARADAVFVRLAVLP